MDSRPSSPWREVPTLRGRHATLAPLQAAHAEDLRSALAGSSLHRAWYTNVPGPDQVETYVARALEAGGRGAALPFVVHDGSGDVVGTTRFYDLQPEVPNLKIGYTWYRPSAQRTGVNTEAKLMLLAYAFETLGCAAVAFETTWFNQASRAAILRLGAKQDGVLRHHKRHADGSLRDTVVLSLIDAEWPAAKRHLRFRLDSHA